ncbi:MAG: gliding motility-associated C-terminal domain-containing protein [Saprospiraceae bacterium]|nr:gliding motility-associated C-terminal domain-containing protein [Saprospiraceae bacterium]
MNTYYSSDLSSKRLFFRLKIGRFHRTLFLAGMCWFSSFAATAQAFQKLYANPDSAFFIAYDLCSDITQGYYVTGAVQVTRPQVFVLKSNLAGQPIWNKIVTSANPLLYYTTGESIHRTSDNGLVITGVRLFGATEPGGVLIKLNDSGNVHWAKFMPCLGRNSEVCADGNSIYYASEDKSAGKVYLAKISNQGQPAWQQWLETGDMDFYSVESLVHCANGDIVLALLVAKTDGGTQIEQKQTILLRINPEGVVQQAAFFPVVHLAALVPLSDGRIAFRCSADDVTWTGMGIMDSQFNFIWFKKARFGLTPFLSNIVGQELAVSGDETQITGIFYTPGGEKTALAFDINGNLLEEEVYATNTLAQAAAAAPARGYVRVTNSTASTFTLTRSYDDGTVFANCFFPNPCGLQLEDTVLISQPVGSQVSTVSCMQDESAVTENLPLVTVDHCIDVGTVDPGFQMTDTVICAGSAVDFTRNSGASKPVFGTSDWSFEGATPSIATGPAVKNVRFNQPGTYSVRHIYTVAGCRDTAFLTITVLASFSVNLGADTTVCSGNGVQISAGTQPGASYLWNTGSTSSVLSVTRSGTYTVTVTLSGGCTVQDAIQVHLLSKDDVALGPDITLCNNGTLRLKAPDSAAGYPLRWSTGETSTSIDIASPGMYSLELAAGNCSFTDTILVEAKDCNGCQVYAANVFAPESGTAGNTFRLIPGCTLVSGRWHIYDRWGSLLFESADLNQGWDGRANGKVLPPGVYLYTAELQLSEPQKPVEQRKISGCVTLVR